MDFKNNEGCILYKKHTAKLKFKKILIVFKIEIVKSKYNACIKVNNKELCTRFNICFVSKMTNVILNKTTL